MIKRIKFTADAFENYLDGLNDKFETSVLWNTLQGKSEYGTMNSEKGYQKVAAVKAYLLAKKLGLKEERTSFFTKCLGAAFPSYGKEGKQCLKEYAAAHNLPYEEKEVMASVIEESFSQSGKLVVEGLRDLLLELFDPSEDSDVKEIELAKLCHEQMEILKICDRTSREEYFKAEKRLEEEIEKDIYSIGIIGCKKLLEQRKNVLPTEEKHMTSEEKEKVFKEIDLYKEYSGEECLINFILHNTNSI